MVIGGYAVTQYTEPRFTKDLNLWIKADPTNAAAVYQALKDFGAPLTNLTESDFAEEGYFYQMGVPPMRVDVLMSVTGLKFEEAWERRVAVKFGELNVTFIAKADLITVKRASGRPQDLIDADSLARSKNK
jgi:hypothetical protein